MTQQVRNGYRNHRKATWALVLGLAAAMAAIVIPIASGDALKTYTMQFPSSGAVTPASLVAGSTTSAQKLCTSFAYTSLKVTITNTAKSSQLGSGDFTFPTSVGSLSGTPTFVSGNNAYATISRTGNVVSLRQLSLPNSGAGASLTFSVGLNTGASAVSNQQITGRVKQSNNFSDSGSNPDANSFTNPTFPTLTTQPCTTSISGRVFLDVNGNLAFDPSGTPADSGQSGWSVALYRTSGAPGQVGNAIVTPADGTYTFNNVQMGADYKVCATQPDNSVAWSQTTPTGNSVCSAPALPAGRVISNLMTAATNQDFGLEETITPSCSSTFDAPLIGTGNGIVGYTAQLTAPPGTLGCKDAIVMYSYLDTNGNPYATIHPPSAAAGGTNFWVVERIQWKVDKAGAQNPVTLKYDDTKPYGDSYKVMKMCTSDPRVVGQSFELAQDPATVMPSGETSCMIESTDFPSGNAYDYEAYVASDVDGIKTPT